MLLKTTVLFQHRDEYISARGTRNYILNYYKKTERLNLLCFYLKGGIIAFDNSQLYDIPSAVITILFTRLNAYTAISRRE